MSKALNGAPRPLCFEEFCFQQSFTFMLHFHPSWRSRDSSSSVRSNLFYTRGQIQLGNGIAARRHQRLLSGSTWNDITPWVHTTTTFNNLCITSKQCFSWDPFSFFYASTKLTRFLLDFLLGLAERLSSK